MKNENAVYTSGSIQGTMLKTAFAMLAGTLAMSGYNLADTYFVGQLGLIPLAAMGFTFPVIMLIGCVFHGLSIGVMTTTAQAIGSHRSEKAARIVTSGLVLVLLISLILSLLGMLFSAPLFSMMGAKGETLKQVTEYMDIWFFGCATASLSMSGNNLLIGAGDSQRASATMVMGLFLNVLLDPILIFGLWGCPEMGIRGAALATILSQCMSTLMVLALLKYHHGLLKRMKFRWKELRNLWGLVTKFAIPASLGMLLMPVGSFLITWITARFGDSAIAATAAAGRLEMVAFVFPMALGISLLPMIGQNFGARKYSRIRACRKFAMGFAFVFLMCMALIYYFFAPLMVAQFSPDPEVRRIMVLCMKIIPWGFCMIEIHRYAGFFYTGCGYPSAAAWLNALRIVGLMIPLSLLALYFNSLEGLFYARLAADVIAGGTGWLLARKMTESLPQKDGERASDHDEEMLTKLLSHIFPHKLKSMAVAQAHIDSASDTQ